MNVDPITFEVVKHRLWQINDEQGVAVKTISASPIVVEGNDFNVGIFTRDGRLVTAGIGALLHVTTLGTAIQSILRLAGEIRDGDAYLLNDPYLGALHQNDVVVASPLFWEGEMVLWVGNVLHHPDVGGIDEGSFCINARTLYQEPPRYFLKVVEAGRMSPEVERTFVANSRLPDAVALDLRAQVGAVHVAKTRLAELLRERGAETVVQVMEGSLADTEERLRQQIRRLPQGRWSAEVFMDGERVGSDRIHRVAVQLERRGDVLRFDYAGSDPQVDAAVNCTGPACLAATSVPVFSFLCSGDIDWNDGLRPCIEVSAPEGTVVNARFPAPVSICSIGFARLVTAAATQVLARMLDASEDQRHRACPSWTPSNNCANIFGVAPGGRRVGALLSDHRAGGSGARSFADGFDHAGQIGSFAANVGNVENTELKLPLLYLFRRQLQDSGGAGRWRGGLTAAAAVVPYRTDELIYKCTNTAGTDESNAAGLDGGYPGAGSQSTVVRSSAVWARFAAGVVPVSVSELGGEVHHLPSKADGVMGPDDVYLLYPPGGGGCGDPLERDPARVADDVRTGRVSPAAALDLYGVVLGNGGGAGPGVPGAPAGAMPPSGAGPAADPRGVPWDACGPLDAAATEQARAAQRRARLVEAQPAAYPLPEVHGSARLGETLAVDAAAGSAGPVHCVRCGHAYRRDGDGGTRGLVALRRLRPLRRAGPWLALPWGGDSPNFELEEWFCPGCGVAFDVRERRRDGAGAR